jgi:hypothetical protein
VARSFQLDAEAHLRPAVPEHADAPLPAHQPGGRLTRIGGRQVLRLAANPATETLYGRIAQRLAVLRIFRLGLGWLRSLIGATWHSGRRSVVRARRRAPLRQGSSRDLVSTIADITRWCCRRSGWRQAQGRRY